MEASSTTRDEKFLTHVVLNELNVLDCFGHDQLSRYLESRMQNNECPVESIISMFENETFGNQHENRAETGPS